MQKLRKLCQVSHTMNGAQERLAIVLPAVSGEAQFRTEDTDGRGLIVGASEWLSEKPEIQMRQDYWHDLAFTLTSQVRLVLIQ